MYYRVTQNAAFDCFQMDAHRHKIRSDDDTKLLTERRTIDAGEIILGDEFVDPGTAVRNGLLTMLESSDPVAIAAAERDQLAREAAGLL